MKTLRNISRFLRYVNFHRIIFAAAVMVALGIHSMLTEAAPIEYTWNDYPTEQGGANLSGTITVDDSGDGFLQVGEIMDWTVNVTNHPSLGDLTFSSTDPNTNLSEIATGAELKVSPTQITIGSPFDGTSRLDLFVNDTGSGDLLGRIRYDRDISFSKDVSAYAVTTGTGPTSYWSHEPLNPVNVPDELGGNTTWIVASAVPVLEPTTFYWSANNSGA